MTYKIISDSSSDLLELSGAPYESVPLKIITDEKEYVDNTSLNVDEMISDLRQYKGTSRTSCPNVGEWKDSFEESESVFCITITSGLSGSYNAASTALQQYLEENPQCKGTVLDSLSTGPESALIIEKLLELIDKKLPFEEIESTIRTYMEKLHLIFSLESLKNLANNGRVSKAVAGLAGILNMRMVGIASEVGTLEITDKVRGTKNALNTIYNNMLKHGYNGGKVRIHHCQNEEAAQTLAGRIKAAFPAAKIQIGKTTALCSFYAESGGLLVGFEDLQPEGV